MATQLAFYQKCKIESGPDWRLYFKQKDKGRRQPDQFEVQQRRDVKAVLLFRYCADAVVLRLL